MMVTEADRRVTSAAALRGVSTVYRRYVLALLLAVNTFSLLDRQILGILQESIKKDLGFSDAQLGTLTGISFAIFYAILGIPIARLADRTVRTRIITVSLCVWSLMTALSGFATGFAMLLACRIGVGIGEAGSTPASHSLIADYFPKERRGTALSIFSLGGPLGVVIGLALGGRLDETVGWRQALLIVGAPGLLVALVTALTLREPPRGLSDGAASQDHGRIMFRDVARVLWTCAPFRNLAAGYILMSFVANAVVNWNPPFYSRLHGLSSGTIGIWLSFLYALPLAVGTFLGGALGDRIGRHDMRWYLWLPGLAILAAIPMSLVQYNAHSTVLSFALSVGPAFAFGMFVGPCFAVTQMLVPIAMRASASAVLLLLVSILGVGLGPLCTGALSDAFRSHGYGPASLGMALNVMTLFLIPAGMFLLAAGRRLPAALAQTFEPGGSGNLRHDASQPVMSDRTL